MKDNKKDFIAFISAIIIFLLVIVIILVSYSIFYKNEDRKNVDIYSKTSYFNGGTISAVAKIDEKQDVVYAESYSYELDFDGTKFEINSVMPVINMDGEYVKLINDEISKYYETTKLNEELYELTYDKYTYDDVISIVVKKIQKRADGSKNISNVTIYNINANSGEIVTNREIINKKSTNIEKISLSLMNEINCTLKKNYNFNIADKTLLIDNKKTAEEYIKEKIYIEKDDNLGNNFKMYLNEKGNICIYFYVPILNTNEKFTYMNFMLG